MIAELLVYECAVVTAQEQMLEDDFVYLHSDFVLDPTRNIYMRGIASLRVFCISKPFRIRSRELVRVTNSY